MMKSKPLSFLDGLLFFLGYPRKPAGLATCYKCESTSDIIDLGDGDYICRKCWDKHIPSVV